MPTLAAGNSNSRRRLRHPCGFTLIEVLVALVIIGLLATTVSLTLPDAAQAQQRTAVRQLAGQLSQASLHAEAHGQPWRWLLTGGSSRLIPPGHAGMPGVDALAVALAWPEGLRLTALEYEGQTVSPPSPLRLGFPPPIFALTLDGSGRRWRIDGDASGHIQITETAR